MTITGDGARPLPLIGQAVGQAQASLTRLLTGILAAAGQITRLGRETTTTTEGNR